jgi:hypothetical protein
MSRLPCELIAFLLVDVGTRSEPALHNMCDLIRLEFERIRELCYSQYQIQKMFKIKINIEQIMEKICDFY